MMRPQKKNFFRFLDKKYVDDLVFGRLCFGSLAYYRDLEKLTGDKNKGDRSDGCGTHKMNGSLINPNEKECEKLKSLGIDMPRGNLTMKNCRSTVTTNCFIFSLSEGRVGKLEKVFQEDGFNYDGRVEVLNPKLLCENIWHNGVVECLSKDLNGKSVQEVFKGCRFDKVEYDRKEVDINISQLDLAQPDLGSPFKKEPRYSRQSEWRIVLFPKNQIRLDHNHIYIRIPAEKLPKNLLVKRRN
jgi:hypothetical protein